MHWNVLLAQTPAPAQTAQTTTATQGTPPPAGASATPQAPPSWMSFAPFALLIVVFYFMLIRPTQQRSKQQAKLMSALKSGDKVVTSSGIVGVVITVKDKTVSIRSADAKMEVTKSSVTEILENSDATPSSQ
jgi:preprotein translocase subunit YajC